MPKLVVRSTSTHNVKGELERVVYVLARDAEGNIYLKRRR